MRTIVYGNGKSRQKWNVNEKLDDVVTWGCNRIFNDVKVDNLVAMDYHVQHLIYESGYAKENKCWFADWNILPSEFGMDYTREGWTKIIENPKTDHGCIINAHETETHKGYLYITWVDKDDMVEDIDFPKEWSSGTTAIHLACQQGAKELYIMGFDLCGLPIYNVYENEQVSVMRDGRNVPVQHWNDVKDAHSNEHLKSHTKFLRTDWVQEMKTVLREFSDVQFIWAEPHERTIKLDYDNLTYDTYENIRRKICR